MSPDDGSDRWRHSALSYMGGPPLRVASRQVSGLACRFCAVHPGHIRIALVLCCALLWAALVWGAVVGAVTGW